VGYVKRNAIAGHRFDSTEALHAHLQRWMHEVADTRVHGTTGELPIVRFERDEVKALKPLPGKAPFPQSARTRAAGAHGQLHRAAAGVGG
jgi:hypothetical protein